MRFVIDRSTSDTLPIEYLVTVSVSVDGVELKRWRTYGVPPLTAPPLERPDIAPLLSVEEADDLPGRRLRRSFGDVRVAEAFIHQMRASHQAILDYWAAAESFDGRDEVPSRDASA